MNIHINSKRIERENISFPEFRVRDYRATTESKIFALLVALFFMSIRRGIHPDMSEYLSNNGTGLTILRANLTEFSVWIQIYTLNNRPHP